MGIFWAVFLALLAFGVVVLLVQGYRQHLEEQAVYEALNEMSRTDKAMVDAGNARLQRERQERARQTAYRKQAERKRQQCDRDARILAINQQCLSGTIIEHKGNAYTQVLGSDGAPVHCRGRYASKPIRGVPGCG